MPVARTAAQPPLQRAKGWSRVAPCLGSIFSVGPHRTDRAFRELLKAVSLERKPRVGVLVDPE